MYRCGGVKMYHGRIETRRIALSSEAIGYLDWPGLAQIAKLERRREIRGRESVETAYLITSLPPDKAGPERMLALARAHWAIENRLHHVRDVSFNEDRCRSRAGARPLATMRNLAIALITTIRGAHTRSPRKPKRRNTSRDKGRSLNDPASWTASQR